jgi:hypothetical protein
MSFLSLAQSAHSAASRLTVRSALNPLLWLCAIISVPCFVLGAYLHTDRITMSILFAIGFVPLGTAVIIALRFAWKHPEKLQSEDYQVRHESLQMLQSALGARTIGRDVIDAVVAISNPALPEHSAAPEEGAAPPAPAEGV